MYIHIRTSRIIFQAPRTLHCWAESCRSYRKNFKWALQQEIDELEILKAQLRKIILSHAGVVNIANLLPITAVMIRLLYYYYLFYFVLFGRGCKVNIDLLGATQISSVVFLATFSKVTCCFLLLEAKKLPYPSRSADFVLKAGLALTVFQFRVSHF